MLFTAAVLLLLQLGGATPVKRNGYSLHEARSGSLSRLQRRGSRVHPDAVVPFKIGLTQSNLDSAYELFMNVSHPASPGYGKHLNVDEVNSIFAPQPDTVAIVREWLAEVSGLDESAILQSLNKGWLAVDLPVRDAERIFLTQYHEHEDRNGHLRIACDAYSLPDHIRPHVDLITPGVKSSPILKKRIEKRGSPPWGSRPGKKPLHSGPDSQGPWQMPPGAQQLPPDLQDCGRNITPTCIRALYDIPRAYLSDSVNSLGVFETGDMYAQSDRNAFFTQYAPNVPNNTAPIPTFIDGAQAPVAADDPTNGGESDIDLDMIYSLIYPQTVTLYQTDDEPSLLNRSETGFMNTFLDAIDGSYCNYTYDGLTGLPWPRSNVPRSVTW